MREETHCRHRATSELRPAPRLKHIWSKTKARSVSFWLSSFHTIIPPPCPPLLLRCVLLFFWFFLLLFFFVLLLLLLGFCWWGGRAFLKTYEGRKEMFHLTTHSTHFIYMASDIWLRSILIVIEETRCRHTGYSFRLAARVLLYAPFHRQNSTYNSICYTSRGALAATRNCSMGPPHEGSNRRPIAPWAKALTTATSRLHLCYINKMV